MSRRLATFIYRWRILLSVAIVIGALLMAPRANFTEIDNDISAWFSREDPVFKDYERFREEFGGTRTLIVALRSANVFGERELGILREISAEIDRVPTVTRVQSLATANVVRSLPETPDDPGGIEVQPLIPRTGTIDAASIKSTALGDALIRGDLVSTDGKVAAIVVSFDEDRIDQVRAGVIERIHQIVDPRLPPGTDAFYNGSLEISETYNRVTVDNTRTFTLPLFLVTMSAIYLMFRSIRTTAIVMVAVLVSILWTLGLYSLLGFTFNVLASMIVPLVVVLAIADDVHMVQHFGHEVRKHGDRARAFQDTVAYLAVPLLGASGTTALGMLSLATSDVVAVKSFGIGSAIGIMVDFAISLVFVPTLLAASRPEREAAPQETMLVRPMRAIARFASARPRLIACVAGGLVIVAVTGIFKLRVDTNHINFFGPRHALHLSADLIDSELSGIYSFQILLEGDPESMTDPDALRRMESLSEKLSHLPFVKKVVSLADYVKRVDRELTGKTEQEAALPGRRDLIAQELFVFSLSDEGRDELSRIVSSDYSRTFVSVKLASMSSDLVFQQIHEATVLAEQEFAGTGMTVTTTGAGKLFSQLDHYLVVSQLSSFGTAFFTVAAVIFMVFRSARFGLLAIVPNLLPVLAVLGVMGWLGISLNVATVMVASVALGVVDDDTIHFINRYRKEAAAGATTDDAIESATVHEGRASLTTALVNSLGFGVLMFSEYKPNAWFGGLLGLTMAVAFLSEVFILPASIKLVPRLFGAESVRGRSPLLPPTLPAVR